MKKKSKKTKHRKTSVSPASIEWLSVKNHIVAKYFYGLGFDNLQQILDMRVFDLMNMNSLNAVRVEEIIICLYQYLNPNTAVDAAMYCGAMSQYFDYTGWRKVHKQLEKITIEDLVMAEDINLRAIQHFYDAIRKKFFKSKDYDWCEYIYANYPDYLSMKESKQGGGSK